MPLGLKIKLLYPQFLVIIFVLASFAPVRITSFDVLFPSVDLMLIFYWCLYRPELLPNWFLFLTGVFKDILSGAPIGINALVNIIMRTLTIYKSSKAIKSQFIIIWQSFAIFTVVAMSSKWVIFSFINNELMSIRLGLIHMAITILIYPLFHLLFSSVHSLLPNKRSDA